jgi:torulene dioxygenase
VAFAPVPRIKVFKISESGKTTILANITHRKDQCGSRIHPAYIHSFWLTENYIIIPESPLFYSEMGLNLLLHGSALSCMKWKGQDPTYFHVISRHNGGELVASIPNRSFFQFHSANAFERKDTNGNIILSLDCVSFPDGNIAYQLHDLGLPKKGSDPIADARKTQFHGVTLPPDERTCFGDLVRYELNITSKTFQQEIPLVHNIEFPRFNQEFMFKNYKYLFGCQLDLPSNKSKQGAGIVKVNLHDKTTIAFHESGLLCAEPIFVKRPEGVLEDDGVVLTLANGKECCYLLILDAKDLKELSRIQVGAWTAITFHGSYVDHDFESISIN